MKTIDILCVGEVLLDFIGEEANKTVQTTSAYKRYLGGSPTNVAVNAVKLGLKSALVATCGNDGLGQFIKDKLTKSNVDVSALNKTEEYPTSIILVSKSTETPDFLPFRQADFHINESQISEQLIESSKIYHTTCFALSKNPARTTILNKAKKAKEKGLSLSIDINYSEKIWPNTEEAISVIKEYLKLDPLVKLSLDDCKRLFKEDKKDQFIFDYFHSLGASLVCLTKGSKGVVVSDKSGELLEKASLKIESIKDATGAGDAFWTGFLYSQLNNKNLEDSVDFAQKIAKQKLQHVGGLPNQIKF